MTDQPKVAVSRNGTLWWRLPNGDPHRDDGPATVWAAGTKCWFQYGKLHRDDGPAITSPDGYEAWFQHGKLHRVDGPAVTRPDGSREWWVDDVQLKGFELQVARRAWEKNGFPR